jgi:hypothetical protein
MRFHGFEKNGKGECFRTGPVLAVVFVRRSDTTKRDGFEDVDSTIDNGICHNTTVIPLSWCIHSKGWFRTYAIRP